MKYYYLDSAKTPQGSFTREEMLAFLADGTVTEETLAAAAGDSEWKPLYLLLGLSAEPTAQPTAQPAYNLGNCPHCGTELTGTAVPAVCPHCAKHLHAGSDSIFDNMSFALKHGLTFRGRATRTEFWSLFLFSYLALLVTKSVFKILLIFSSPVQQIMRGDRNIPIHDVLDVTELIQYGDVLHDWVLMGCIGGMILVNLVLWFYLTCAVTRRLHDRGWSGWLQLRFYVVVIAFMGICLTSLDHWVSTAHWVSTHPADSAKLAPYARRAFCDMLVFLAFSIWFFVQMALPGTRGANKYGPDRINPKG